MQELPPDDQPDAIEIGPVTGIPIVHDDDPRFEADRQSWSAARRKAQAMLTDEDLLAGLADDDWRVRNEVIDRAIARVEDHSRLIPTLLDLLSSDPSWEVRASVAIQLSRFPAFQVADALTPAKSDSNRDVRWSAAFSLFHLGLGPAPPDC